MKKTKILFYDDEPQTNKKLRSALVRTGFEVISPKDFNEAAAEVSFGGVKLLIHCGLHTRTYWDICKKILDSNPDLPSLHIAVGEAAEEFQKQFKGLLHQKLRPLAPQEAFIRKVKSLLFSGKLFNKNKIYRKTILSQIKMESLLDSQNLFEFKQKSTLIFLDQFQARNVLYFDCGEVPTFIGSNFNESEIYNVSQMLSDEHRVIAAQYTDAFEVQSFLKAAVNVMPAGWERRRQPHGYMQHAGVPRFMVLPLVTPTKNDVLGHFFILDPRDGVSRAELELIDIVHKSLGRYSERVLNLMDAKDKSYIDDLTDLYNQRYLRLVLDKEINRAQRSNSCFSVLFMDIDHFKRVNDTRGHVVGSKLLKKLAKILSDNIRTVDYGFRYGGDEFIMILVGSDAEQAKVVAERTRKQVEECIFDIDGVKIQVTLSIGIASCPEHATTKEQILEMADQAMYVGKSKSRNVVFVAS